jgi:hypothetical protein
MPSRSARGTLPRETRRAEDRDPPFHHNATHRASSAHNKTRVAFPPICDSGSAPHDEVRSRTLLCCRLACWLVHSFEYGVALARLDGWYAKELAWARRPLAEAGLSKHPVRDDTTEQVKAATAGRLFTRHGGNVLPLFATDG